MHKSAHVANLHLLACRVGFECKMAEWHTILDQLDIPDGAVAGLSASDKPVLRGNCSSLPLSTGLSEALRPAAIACCGQAILLCWSAPGSAENITHTSI